MGRKYVANAFHNRSLIDSNKGGGGGGGAAEEYVAEETKIGTFLGKDLYRQVIDTRIGSSSFDIPVTGIKQLINAYGPGTGYAMVGCGDWIIILGTDKVRFSDNAGGSIRPGTQFIVVIEYTKD